MDDRSYIGQVEPNKAIHPQSQPGLTPDDGLRFAEKDAPLSEGGFQYADRAAILCRTCLRPLTWETRTEPGYLPRTGWYDDARSDPLVCFKARDYRHEPLTDREWAYYEAGQRSVGSGAHKRGCDVWAGRECNCPGTRPLPPPGKNEEPS